MYPDQKVVAFVADHFVPVRVHVRDNPDEFQRLGARFDAHWTPTILIVDEDGHEKHRVEGFLPSEDLVAQLRLGLGHAAFARGDFTEAGRWFRQLVEQTPSNDAAPEAQYWAGVARYKATGDASALAETGRQFQERYQDSSWAKKASVWLRS